MTKPLSVSPDFPEFPLSHTRDGENLSHAIGHEGFSAVPVAVTATNPFQKSCCPFTPWI